MKKRIKGRKFSRGSGARRALFRALIRAQVAYGKIVTTKVKAKVIQRQIDKLVNLAKEGGVSKRRQVYAALGNDRKTTDDLFLKIAPIFSDRVGGYTRIINLPRRRGDAAEMARLEWVKETGLLDEGKSKKSAKKKEVKKSVLKKGIKRPKRTEKKQ